MALRPVDNLPPTGAPDPQTRARRTLRINWKRVARALHAAGNLITEMLIED